MQPQRWASVIAPALVAVPFLLTLNSCRDSVNPSPDDPPPKDEPWFEDVTEASRIKHTYDAGQDVTALTIDGRPLPDFSQRPRKVIGDGHPIRGRREPIETPRHSGHLSILETLGGGAGLIDYDGDGLYDIFLPGGGTYIGDNRRTIVGRPCKLYKNMGHFQFQDITAEVGLDRINFYTHGVAVADYNRDGWPDLLVTGWGRLALFRNDPVDPNDPSKGRKFTDVTQETGLNDHLWSTSAGWADFDGDGFVDLYVVHYVDWHFGKTEKEEESSHPACTLDRKLPDYCPPNGFAALPHIVYRNNGDGTFTDVSRSAGLRGPRTEADYKPLHEAYVAEALASGRAERAAQLRHQGILSGMTLRDLSIQMAEAAADDICGRLRHNDAVKDYGKGLGLVIVDINGDGKPDVFVSCDTTENLLYVNRSRPGHILFEEMGGRAGVARDDRGEPTGSMGTDAADYHGTLRPSLWCVNFENEKHGLYQNLCAGDTVVFRYATQLAGIAAIGQQYVSWGTRFVDFNLGGLQHLFISNGHVNLLPIKQAKRFEKPMVMQCCEDAQGQRRFVDVTERHGGSYCQKEHCGRGVAFGDLDNDGRIDLVLVPLEEPVAVLKTVAGSCHHWIGFELKRKDNRDPVGARLVLNAGGKKQGRFAKGGGSYLAANDPRHVFGLGTADKIDKVTVTWPDLREQTWQGLAVDRYWVLEEGRPEAQPPRQPRRE
jgi:hypothetical protein